MKGEKISVIRIIEFINIKLLKIHYQILTNNIRKKLPEIERMLYVLLPELRYFLLFEIIQGRLQIQFRLLLLYEV